MENEPAKNKKIVLRARAEDGPGMRFDAFIAYRLHPLSRSKARKLVEAGAVTLNGRRVKPDGRVSAGDTVTVEMPAGNTRNILPEKMLLEVIYQDQEIMVVNKPPGLIVHPTETVKEGTLVNALLERTERLSSINGPMRRGIVHRLDKDTSGLLLIARTDRAHLRLAEQFSERKVERVYRALVLGNVEPETGEISAPIGRHSKNRLRMSISYIRGREASTAFRVMKKFKSGKEFFSLLEIRLGTGRTHQIRVHFASIGYPVCGDPRYGRKSPLITMRRQALHAETLGFVHPVSGKRLSFSAGAPDDMESQINALERLNELI